MLAELDDRCVFEVDFYKKELERKLHEAVRLARGRLETAKH